MAPATGPGTGTRHLTDRERYRVRVLFFDGHKTRAEIASITGYTPRQITNAIRHETVAPRTGRPPSLTPAQQERLDSFVSESVENSRMTYQKISQTLFDGQVGESAIRNTLHRLGYRRNGAFNAGARLVRSHPRQMNASTPSGSGEIPPPTAPTDTNVPPTSTNPPPTTSSTNTNITPANEATPVPTAPAPTFPASVPSIDNPRPLMSTDIAPSDTTTPTIETDIGPTSIVAPLCTAPTSTGESRAGPNEDVTAPSINEASKTKVENNEADNAP